MNDSSVAALPSHAHPLPHPARTASQEEVCLPTQAPQSAPVEQVDVELDPLTPVLTRRELRLMTERAFHVFDVTDHCAALVADSRAEQGTLTVFTPHTTCAIKINEWESGFLEDLRSFMAALVPAEADYRHDDFEVRDPETLAGDAASEPLNGHSHIQQMLLGAASETVPIVDGQLGLGSWQRAIFIELDRARVRRLQIHVQGWRAHAL